MSAADRVWVVTHDSWKDGHCEVLTKEEDARRYRGDLRYTVIEYVRARHRTENHPVVDAYLRSIPEKKMVAVFAAGSFEEVVNLGAHRDARAFCYGVSVGGSHFGDGATGYVWPEDEVEMREAEDPEEIRSALIALGVIPNPHDEVPSPAGGDGS